MGEAKRRQALDLNFGKPRYAYRISEEAEIVLLVVDRSARLPIETQAYERCAQSIVDEYGAALQRAASCYRAKSPEEASEGLCLLVMHPKRSGTPVGRLLLGFCSIGSTQTLWRRALRRQKINDTAIVGEQFDAVLSGLEPEQLLWSYLEPTEQGSYIRPVPVRHPEIAQLCRGAVSSL